MRLNMEEVQKQHKSTKKLYEQGLTVAPVDVKRVLDLYDTIEALQQENEQLKADCDRMLGEVQELTMESNHFKERLQISPYGDDKIDELDEALENCKFQYEQLKQENEQLRAKLGDWKYEVQCHMDEVTAREKQIEQLQAQAARMWEALRKAREVLYNLRMDDYPGFSAICEALAEIDKVTGGKEE